MHFCEGVIYCCDDIDIDKFLSVVFVVHYFSFFLLSRLGGHFVPELSLVIQSSHRTLLYKSDYYYYYMRCCIIL